MKKKDWGFYWNKPVVNTPIGFGRDISSQIVTFDMNGPSKEPTPVSKAMEKERKRLEARIRRKEEELARIDAIKASLPPKRPLDISSQMVSFKEGTLVSDTRPKKPLTPIPTSELQDDSPRKKLIQDFKQALG